MSNTGLKFAKVFSLDEFPQEAFLVSRGHLGCDEVLLKRHYLICSSLLNEEVHINESQRGSFLSILSYLSTRNHEITCI